MLMYPDHLQYWLDYGHGLVIFTILALFDLVKRVKFGVSMHFWGNWWGEWHEILHADVSWPPSELIWFWLWSANFSNFGAILTSNLGFPGISWGIHCENGLKFSMLMYLRHLQKWFDYGHNLLIFLILVLFWISETGQIWGFWVISGERVGVNCRGGSGGIFPTLCVEFCLVLLKMSWLC